MVGIQIFSNISRVSNIKYLLIASITKDHLAILATSADSEQVFSVSSDIITKK